MALLNYLLYGLRIQHVRMLNPRLKRKLKERMRVILTDIPLLGYIFPFGENELPVERHLPLNGIDSLWRLFTSLPINEEIPNITINALIGEGDSPVAIFVSLDEEKRMNISLNALDALGGLGSLWRLFRPNESNNFSCSNTWEK